MQILGDTDSASAAPTKGGAQQGGARNSALQTLNLYRLRFALGNLVIMRFLCFCFCVQSFLNEIIFRLDVHLRGVTMCPNQESLKHTGLSS